MVHLSHLRFAHDIVLFSTESSEVQSIINQLNERSGALEFEINNIKTKIMLNTSEQSYIFLNGTSLETIEICIYLVQKLRINKDSMAVEMKRRI